MVNIHRGPENEPAANAQQNSVHQATHETAGALRVVTHPEAQAQRLQELAAQLNSRSNSRFNEKTRRRYEEWLSLSDIETAERQLEKWIRSALDRGLSQSEILCMQQLSRRIADGSTVDHARQAPPSKWADIGPDSFEASIGMNRSNDDHRRAA